MIQHYKHSGTVPFGGLVATAVAGLGTAMCLAVVYSYAIVYIPFIYINFFLTLGFGFGVGKVIAVMAQAKKMRSSSIPLLLGAVTAVVGWYVSWGVDFLARAGIPDNGSLFVAFDPRLLLGYVQMFFDQGFWGIGRANLMVSGIPLAIVWLIEATVIIGLAAFTARSEMLEMVFCEACDCWANQQKNVSRLSATCAADLVAGITRGDLSVLRNAQRATDSDMSFVGLNLASCDVCNNCNYLSVDLVTTSLDKNGKPETKVETAVHHQAISTADTALVRDAGQPPATAGTTESAADEVSGAEE